MEKKHIASVSFGRDSLAMLLRLIETKAPLDEVVFYDHGMEFKALYAIRDKVKPHIQSLGIGYVELRPEHPFEYYMFEKPVCRQGTGIIHKHGYSWCGGACRWGTSMKLQAIEKYCKGHYEYVGIAFDEPERLAKERKGNKLFPLAEWRMTEKDCLNYCYDSGFNWRENGHNLYDIMDRVSCWCCRNKNLKELRNMYLYLPQYWQGLKALQARTSLPMKGDKSVFDLEKRFAEETRYEQLSMWRAA